MHILPASPSRGEEREIERFYFIFMCPLLILRIRQLCKRALNLQISEAAV